MCAAMRGRDNGGRHLVEESGAASPGAFGFELDEHVERDSPLHTIRRKPLPLTVDVLEPATRPGHAMMQIVLNLMCSAS